MKQHVFKIQGMDCAEEAALLRRALSPLLEDERDLSFDVLHAKMILTGDRYSTENVVKAVAGTGLKALPWQDTAQTAPPSAWWGRHGRTLVCAFSCILLAVAFVAHGLQQGFYAAVAAGEGGGTSYPWAAVAAYAASIVLSASFFAPKAWVAVRYMRPDINLLVVIAAAGAVVLNNWFEAATVSLLFAFALLLESWSVGRARRAITKLMDLSPATARYRCPHDGDILEKPVDQIPLGANVLVRPGERIPLDGTVIQGSTSVNQAPITGESVPVYKQIGDPVFAGSVNNEGAFEFRVDKTSSDTTLARIIHMVEEAQSRRAVAEQWVESFARYYTPAMMIVAVAVAVLPPILLSASWSYWFYESLVVLLIACPCALVISTPVTIVAGLASAARHGVLIKGGAYLEIPARLRAVALDKTGTLTYGEPSVRRVVPFNGHTEAELLERAAAVESLSEHPLARAIVRHADDNGIAYESAGSYTTVPGKGAEATMDGRRFWVGNEAMAREFGNSTHAEVSVQAALYEERGNSVVMIGTDRHVCGLIALEDAIRPNTADAIRVLKRDGIEHVAMLTGDNHGTAEALASKAGVDEFHAEMLPQDKVHAVEALRQRFVHVAMVGDGINDAPAMAASSLGIAMGAAGADAAIETADVALMADDLTKVAWLIRHSRRTLRIVRQNVVLALGIKGVVMLLAICGVATLWLAVLSDMGASLLVIFNGLRLLRDPIRST